MWSMSCGPRIRIREINVDVRGDLRGNWDDQRMQQLLSNLLTNALKYGTANTPVRASAIASDDEVTIEIGNSGPPVAPDLLERIFDPLQRGTSPSEKSGEDVGLGLGLYIASEIAHAHRGRIDARSDASETVAVRLPRRA
jgi:signal transduction histidine kinase